MTTLSKSSVEHGEAGVEHQEPKGDYPVGYARPPVEHRFKPGNNANPKGRKKKTRNRKVVISELLFEPVTVREGGEVKQMAALEAVLKKLLSKALTGDNKRLSPSSALRSAMVSSPRNRNRRSTTCPRAIWRSCRTP
jgi:hypothetical protein